MHIANSNTTRRSTSASDPVTCTRTYPRSPLGPAHRASQLREPSLCQPTRRPSDRSPREHERSDSPTVPGRGVGQDVRVSESRDIPHRSTSTDQHQYIGKNSNRTRHAPAGCTLQLAGLLPRGRVRKAEAYLSCPAMITLLNDVACQCRFDQCAHVNHSWTVEHTSCYPVW